MNKYDRVVMDLMEIVMLGEVSIPELRECVDEIERSIRDVRTRTSDLRVRRRADAALGLKPWPGGDR